MIANNNYHSMKKLLTLAFALASIFTASAQSTHYYATNGIAVNGYDVVSYFTDNKAVKGTDTYTYQWQDVTWKFSTAANLDSFKTHPQLYAPQYGGWCAYGVSDNHKSPTDPDAFTIKDGKLYLNYSKGVKKIWIKDTTRYIPLANQFWPALNATRE